MVGYIYQHLHPRRCCFFNYHIEEGLGFEDRQKLRSSFEAGVNRLSLRLGNEPVPTGQRCVGTRLLSPFKNRHSSNQKLVTTTHINY